MTTPYWLSENVCLHNMAIPKHWFLTQPTVFSSNRALSVPHPKSIKYSTNEKLGFLMKTCLGWVKTPCLGMPLWNARSNPMHRQVFIFSGLLLVYLTLCIHIFIWRMIILLTLHIHIHIYYIIYIHIHILYYIYNLSLTLM